MGNLEGIPPSADCSCPCVSIETQPVTSPLPRNEVMDVTTNTPNYDPFTNKIFSSNAQLTAAVQGTSISDIHSGIHEKIRKSLLLTTTSDKRSIKVSSMDSSHFTASWTYSTEKYQNSFNNFTLTLSNCTCGVELSDSWFIHQRVCELILLIVSIFIVITNAIVIASIARNKWEQYGKRSRSSRSHILMLNLALADLFVGLVNIVCTSLHQIHGHVEAYESCLLQISFLIAPCCASVFTMTLIGVDRYLAVMHPLHYKSWVTSKKVLLTVFLVWLLACVIGFAPVMGWGILKTKETHEETICSYLYVVEPSYVLFTLFGGFLPQLILIVYLYVRIFKVSKKHQKQISQLKANTFACSVSPHHSSVSPPAEEQFSIPVCSRSCPVTPIMTKKRKGDFLASNDTRPPLNPRRTVSFGVPISSPSSSIATPRSSIEIEVVVQPRVEEMIASENVFDTHLNLPGSVFPSKPLPALQQEFPSTPRRRGFSSRSLDVGKLRKTVSYAGSAAITSITSQINRIGNLKKDMMKHNIKALRTVTLVVGFFFLMWTPFLVASVVQMLCGNQCELKNLVGTYLLLLGITNSVINPLVYSYTNKELKQQIRHCCRRNKERFLTNHHPMGSETPPELSHYSRNPSASNVFYNTKIHSNTTGQSLATSN